MFRVSVWAVYDIKDAVEKIVAYRSTLFRSNSIVLVPLVFVIWLLCIMDITSDVLLVWQHIHLHISSMHGVAKMTKWHHFPCTFRLQQTLNDFQNSFTVRIRRKFLITGSLEIHHTSSVCDWIQVRAVRGPTCQAR